MVTQLAWQEWTLSDRVFLLTAVLRHQETILTSVDLAPSNISINAHFSLLPSIYRWNIYGL